MLVGVVPSKEAWMDGRPGKVWVAWWASHLAKGEPPRWSVVDKPAEVPQNAPIPVRLWLLSPHRQPSTLFASLPTLLPSPALQTAVLGYTSNTTFVVTYVSSGLLNTPHATQTGETSKC